MAHTTAITIRFIAPYTLTWIPAQSNRQLCRLRNDGLFDPPSLDAGIYDDCLAILTRHHETIEDTCIRDGLSVLGFAPTLKIIGGTITKIFNGPYAVFTEGSYQWRLPVFSIADNPRQPCEINRGLAAANIAIDAATRCRNRSLSRSQLAAEDKEMTPEGDAAGVSLGWTRDVGCENACTFAIIIGLIYGITMRIRA